MITLKFDNVEIKTNELIKKDGVWSEHVDVMLTGDYSRGLAISAKIHRDELEQIEMSNYELIRMIRLARDTNNHLVLVNRAKTHVLIIDNKYLRTLKYVNLLKEVISEEYNRILCDDEVKTDINLEMLDNQISKLKKELEMLEEKKVQLLDEKRCIENTDRR